MTENGGEGEGDKEADPEMEEETFYVGFTGRTASGMLKDMFNPYSPFSSPGRIVHHHPGSTSPSFSASSVSTDSIVMSPERTSSCSEPGPSLWKIPRESFESHEEEEIVSAGETVTSDDEEEDKNGEGEGADEGRGSDEGHSPASSRSSGGFKNSMPSTSSISSISTNTSDDAAESAMRSEETGGTTMRNGLLSRSLLTMSDSPLRKMRGGKKSLFSKSSSKEEMSASDVFLQNFNPKAHTKKVSDPGFYTIRRPNSNKGKNKAKGSKRFSIKPSSSAKARSVDAEISSPSPVVISSASLDSPTSNGGGEKPLMRQTAIRSKKGMRINQGGYTQTIPEASYVLELSKINAVFKSNKMEVPCRGEQRGWGSTRRRSLAEVSKGGGAGFAGGMLST